MQSAIIIVQSFITSGDGKNNTYITRPIEHKGKLVRLLACWLGAILVVQFPLYASHDPLGKTDDLTGG